MGENSDDLTCCDLGLEPRFALNDVKWGEPTFGTSGGQVTWSAATTNFQEQPFNFEGALTGEFQTAVREAFDAWESVANIDFVEVDDS